MNRFLITLLVAVTVALSGKAIVIVDGIYYTIDNITNTAWVKDTNKTATTIEWNIEAVDCRPWYNSNNTYAGDIIIPENITVDGEKYTVIGIAAGAFAEAQELTGVTMPNSITEVMIGAFYGCTNLREIKFSNQTRGLRFITLEGCTSLTKLDLSGIKDYIQLSVDNHPKLTDVILPDSALIYDIRQSEKAQPCNFYINSPYPPSPVYKNIEVSHNTLLYLPKDGKDNYELLNLDNWGFGAIREMDFADTEVPEVKAQRYCLNGSTLTAGDEECVEVYDVQGRLATVLTVGGKTELAPGAYVLRCGDRSDKVLVR